MYIINTFIYNDIEWGKIGGLNMKYIITLFWGVLLFHMVNFILNSLAGGGPMDLVQATIASLIFGVIVILFALVLDLLAPKVDEESTHH